LVEVLAAVVILGIAGVAVMAGLMMSVKASDIHRKETTSSAYVRNFAEAIENYVAAGHYAPCAAADAYKVGPVTSQLPSLPLGYTATQGAAASIGPTGVSGACPSASADTGVQEVILEVTSGDGRADERLAVMLREPCAKNVAAGGDPCN